MSETSAAYNEHCLPLSVEYDIAICTYAKSQSSLFIPKEIKVFEGDAPLPLRNLFDLLRGTSFFRALKAALADKEYDIIHVHSPHVGFLFLVATMFRRGKEVPTILSTVHDSYPNFKLRNKLLLLPMFARFDRVVCCSSASYKSFPRLYKWLAGDRLCTVPNGLDIERIDNLFSHAQKFRRNNNFTVTSVGRLIEIKNPLAIIGAFQQSADPSSRLVFIGEGPLYDVLLKEAGALGLSDRIELTGLIPRNQVFQELRQTDLFISASLGEGLPVAVLEAMACRCPVLLSAIEPHREISAGTDFIPLIQPDDVAGFAREINRFREMSVADRAKIGERCRRHVEDRFSLSAMHKGYAEIYSQLVNEKAVIHRRSSVQGG
ncbi:MAG: glycosyltransferase family 4 protein [Gammaproteobacteria bacterium]